MKSIIKGALIGLIIAGIYSLAATVIVYLVMIPFDERFPAAGLQSPLALRILVLLPSLLFVFPVGLISSTLLSPFGIEVLGNSFNLLESLTVIITFALLGGLVGAFVGLIVASLIKISGRT